MSLMDETPVIHGNLIPVLRGTDSAGKLSLTTASAASSAFTETMVIVFKPTVACFIKIGEDPTAASDGTTDYLFGAVESAPYMVRAGEKIAGIVGASTGELYWSKVG